jgi:hypothetical protein
MGLPQKGTHEESSFDADELARKIQELSERLAKKSDKQQAE